MNILIDGQTLHTEEINRGIGIYYIEMIEAMLRKDFENIFYINIDDTSKLNYFSEFARNKLKSIVNKNCNPLYLLNQNNKNTNELYSNLINTICSDYNVDSYWNANPLMDTVLIPINNNLAKYTATIHDLIPYVMKDMYLTKWSKNNVESYKKKLGILKGYDLLFPISKHTKKDIIECLGIAEEKQVVTFEGVSDKFKPYPFPIINSSEKYILYLGGFDPRKNMFSSIDAFCLFLKEYNIENIDYKLYIVCSLDEISRNKLLKYAKEKKVETKIILTGFVEENKLLNLYKKAQCFFFPSLYEGFGLPILEALASGLPIACANNSSLPEVARSYAHYFDAYKIEDMAIALSYALKESTSLTARKKRFKYASQFDWTKPANKILESFTDNSIKKQTRPRKKIAWVSPFPPQKSGISIYSKALLIEMKDKTDVVLYYDNILPDNDLVSIFKSFPLKDLPASFDQYDEVIYHLGNQVDFHKNIYKYAWEYPSTVVIHDWNIHPFMQHSFLNTKDKKYYEDSIRIYGEEGIRELESIKVNGYPDIWKFSMSDAIVKRSKRAIVHHYWVKKALRWNSNVDVIPLYSKINTPPSYDQISNFRNKYNIADNCFLISCFGNVNENKMPFEQIEAIKKMLDQGYPVKLFFAGSVPSENKYLFDQLKRTNYQDKIITSCYLSSEEYYSCLYACDLVINLRNPSMGEASLTLTEALFAGKPTIIGNSNQYKEYPDEIVAGKVNYDGTEVEQLVNIIKKTLSNIEYRNNIKTKTKEYSHNVLGMENVVKKYLGKNDAI